MQTNHDPKRRRQEVSLNAELLESRQLMTGGAGDTFAILRGDVIKAGAPATLKFTIDPGHFTLPKGKVTIGIDVAPTTDSTLKPFIRSVSESNGTISAAATHAVYDRTLKQTQAVVGGLTSAVTTQVKVNPKSPTAPVSYTVNIDATAKSMGKYLVGFFLPGDANGDGKVDQTDVSAVKVAMNTNANSTKYNFEADANRDGRINATDLMLTKKNLGAKTDISPVVSANLDPTNNVGLSGRVTSQKAVTFSGVATPGATVSYQETANKVPTVSAKTDSTGAYKLSVPIGTGENTFQVTTSDSFGQAITGKINPVTYMDPAQVVTPSTVPTPPGLAPVTTVTKT